MNVGFAAHYASGTPLTARGYSGAYQNWEYYLSTRGQLGRGPADYEADFHIGYPINVSTGHLNIIGDIFNILDRQAKTAVDLRYNRAQDATCAGFIVPAGKTTADVCNGDGGGGLVTIPGTLTPVSSVNLNAAPNPDFLKAGTAFTAPRTFRLGLRYTF